MRIIVMKPILDMGIDASALGWIDMWRRLNERPFQRKVVSCFLHLRYFIV